jgi:hypothetical protein
VTATVEAPATNQHQPVEEGSFYRCATPDCHYSIYTYPIRRLPVDRNAEYWASVWQSTHARQYDPGNAPDITVDWEISACCSVCPDGIGDVGTDADGDGVQCKECGTHWTMDGTLGERAEEDQ